MRKVIRKLFFAMDFEKEEQWINEMSAKGLQLVSVGFCRYEFEECEQDEYTYRLELLKDLPKSHKSKPYIEFLEETGAELIDTYMRWAYFRKKTNGESFEIYSDTDSKIKHYDRIRAVFFALIPLQVVSIVNTLRTFRESQNWVPGTLFSLCCVFVIILGVGIVKTTKRMNELKKEKSIKDC